MVSSHKQFTLEITIHVSQLKAYGRGVSPSRKTVQTCTIFVTDQNRRFTFCIHESILIKLCFWIPLVGIILNIPQILFMD
jgi:hypothetical protein